MDAKDLLAKEFTQLFHLSLHSYGDNA